MNIAWLRSILEKHPDQNAEIVVTIGTSYYPLAGKIDRIGFAFTDKEGKMRGHEVIALTILEHPLLIDNLSVDDKGSLN